MRLCNSVKIGAVVLAWVGAASVWAGPSVSAVSPYAIDATKTVAFAGSISIAAPASGFMDTAAGFSYLSLLSGFSKQASPTATSMMLFDVSTSVSPAPAGSHLSVVVGVGTSTAGSTAVNTIVPIAAADSTGLTIPTLCSGVNAACDFVEAAAQANGNFLYDGARLTPGVNTRVGIFLTDLCAKNPGLAGVCDNSSPSIPLGPSTAGGAAPTTLNVAISFYIITVPDGTARPTPPWSTDATTGTQVSIQFYQASTDIQGYNGEACSPFAGSAPYFPGDSQIFLDTSRVAPLLPAAGGNAPNADALMILGNETGTAPVAGNYSVPSAFPISAHGATAGTQLLTGFTNSDPAGTLHRYTLFLAYHDRTGMIGPFSCKVTPVQTAAILGFLKKNSCFIATGAFHGETSLAIPLLRKFRDEVLSQSHAGRQLRNWYYSWSPRAGWWLLENPEFRFPVLKILLPIEMVAWLFLHPLLAMALGSLGLLVIMGAVFARNRKGEGMA